MTCIRATLISLLFIFGSLPACSADDEEPAPSESTEANTEGEETTSGSGTEEPCVDNETTVVEWGVATCVAPDVFAASDVSQATIELTLEWYGLGSESWGNYGPVEIYIIGQDRDAARALEEDYCTRHKALDPSWREEWDCANQNYEIFTHYTSDGGAAVSTLKRNYLDYDFMMLIVSAKYPGPEEEDYKPVVLHETFHIYQHAHISDECSGDSREDCGRDDKNGGKDKPWFAEGGAEFMAQSLYAKQPGVRENYLREIMERKLNTLDAYHAQDTRLEDLTYSDPVNAYDIGTWFIAYLIHHEGEETFRVDFYRDLDTLGFDAAFEQHFGKTPRAYVDEFDLFSNQPREELLAIIPAGE